MNDQLKNMLIGVFVLIASALTVSLILFLRPSVGDGKKTINVRFSNINKISLGTRVMWAGKPVGEVVAIDQIYDAREKPRVDPLGRIYFYQLVLKVDSSVQVYDTDEIVLQTSGLLGEKSIAIIPKLPPKGVEAKLITDQPIYADAIDPIENAFVELSEVANDMEETFQQITDWISTHGEDVAESIHNFGGAMKELDCTLCTVNKQKLVDDVQTAIKDFSSAMQGVDKTMNDIASGKGTLGKLIEDDELYLRFNSIMTKLDTVMNDINHYGLLFGQNKSWQRTRSKRSHEIDALCTPEDFKAYFAEEVNQINLSMARLSSLVDKADESVERSAIFQSVEFRKNFAELMRDVSGLQNNLKLYNQQLLEVEATAPCSP